MISPQKDADAIQQKWEDKMLREIKREDHRKVGEYHLADLLPFIKDGVEHIADDGFTKCFQKNEAEPWNWNVYLYPAWLVGAFVRWCILLPIRMTSLVIVSGILSSCLVGSTYLPVPKESKNWLKQRIIVLMAQAWLMAFSGVVKYHGSRPKVKPNQVYVANHTCLLDILVFLGLSPFALVGQGHQGLVGWFQRVVLDCLGSIWFERWEAKDRKKAHDRIVATIKSKDAVPLLLFPEGTCVNNEYVVQFKKGAFELGATIIPVAVKYNKLFSDAFWNSRKESFLMYVVRLMTNWALVVDVYFLEPTTQQPGETAIEFAERVKSSIAERGGLENTQYNGYMKYLRPSQKVIGYRQKRTSRSLLRLLPETPAISRKHIHSSRPPSGGGDSTSSEDSQASSNTRLGEPPAVDLAPTANLRPTNLPSNPVWKSPAASHEPNKHVTIVDDNLRRRPTAIAGGHQD